MAKKIDTRGRKREARRWIEERDARCHAMYPLAERGPASFREYERLRDEDPVLFAAVNEANWAEVRKFLALSKAEVWAQWKRRCEQIARQRRRGKRATP